MGKMPVRLNAFRDGYLRVRLDFGSVADPGADNENAYSFKGEIKDAIPHPVPFMQANRYTYDLLIWEGPETKKWHLGLLRSEWKPGAVRQGMPLHVRLWQERDKNQKPVGYASLLEADKRQKYLAREKGHETIKQAFMEGFGPVGNAFENLPFRMVYAGQSSTVVTLSR